MDKDKRPIDGQSYRFSKKRTRIDQLGPESDTSEEEQKPPKKKTGVVFLRCQPSQKQVQFNDETETTHLPLTAFTREEDIHPSFSSVAPISLSVTVNMGPSET